MTDNPESLTDNRAELWDAVLVRMEGVGVTLTGLDPA